MMIRLLPIPGLAFNDVHGEFDGQATGLGSLSWETEDGRTLSGSFWGVDKEPFLFAPDGQPLAFQISILVVFRDTQGRFAGLAIADGVDDPLGVVSQNPAAAGVIASFSGFLF